MKLTREQSLVLVEWADFELRNTLEYVSAKVDDYNLEIPEPYKSMIKFINDGGVCNLILSFFGISGKSPEARRLAIESINEFLPNIDKMIRLKEDLIDDMLDRENISLLKTFIPDMVEVFLSGPPDMFSDIVYDENIREMALVQKDIDEVLLMRYLWREIMKGGE